MRRKRRHVLRTTITLLILGITTIQSFGSVSVFAADSATTRYKKYLRGKYCNYKIVDVDGNGVKELICSDSDLQYVFTYDKYSGGMIRLLEKGIGKGTAMPQYNRKKHQIWITSVAVHGESEDIVYRLSGRKLTKVTSFSFENCRDWSKPKKYVWVKTYYVNGRQVSKKTYNRKYKAAHKGFK